MSSSVAGPTRERLLSGPFRVWLGAASLAMLADGVLYFALGWEAARLGGSRAGLVLSLITLPRTVLLLIGGSAADRWGLRRTVLVCDIAAFVALLGFVVAAGAGVSRGLLLALLAVSLGVLSSFRMPAAGAFPRLLFDGKQLARAMSMSGSLLNLARLAGPPLGGVLVAAVALRGVVGVVGACYLAVFVLVLRVRTPTTRSAPSMPGSAPERQGIRAALRAVRQVSGALPLLLGVAAMAGSLLTVLSLLVPLAARERGWTAAQTGLIEATWLAGTLGISLLVARFGALRRPIRALATGPLLAAAGALAIAVSPEPGGAAVAAVVLGIGTALFTSHVVPLFVLQTPDGMLARFQALLGLAQALPILVATNLLGGLAQAYGAGPAMAVAAGCCLMATAAAASSPVLRAAVL